MIGSKDGERIAIFGGLGNMGRRYACILRCLGLEPIIVDVHSDPVDLDTLDGIIIATPTDTHLDLLDDLIGFEGPILCEKPLSTNPAAVGMHMEAYMDAGMNLSMVDQYRYALKGKGSNGLGSYYNYYNSGGDGTEWDCINIIYNSASIPTLSNSSPVWYCAINGKELSRHDIDQAYITMIEDWLTRKEEGYEHILRAHTKVVEYTNVKDTVGHSS